ncbi:hypothetical protein AMTRI_Chr11g99320 [Amborella trichopoda]
MAFYQLPANLLILAVLMAASSSASTICECAASRLCGTKRDAGRRSTTSTPRARTFLGWISARQFWTWDHNAASHFDFGFLLASDLISSPSSTLTALSSSRAWARGLRLHPHPESLSRQKPLSKPHLNAPKMGACEIKSGASLSLLV